MCRCTARTIPMAPYTGLTSSCRNHIANERQSLRDYTDTEAYVIILLNTILTYIVEPGVHCFGKTAFRCKGMKNFLASDSGVGRYSQACVQQWDKIFYLFGELAIYNHYHDMAWAQFSPILLKYKFSVNRKFNPEIMSRVLYELLKRIIDICKKVGIRPHATRRMDNAAYTKEVINSVKDIWNFFRDDIISICCVTRELRRTVPN